VNPIRFNRIGRRSKLNRMAEAQTESRAGTFRTLAANPADLIHALAP